jgi:hypothetical protein
VWLMGHKTSRDRRVAEARARWLQGLAVGAPVRVVQPGAGDAGEHTRVTAVRAHTIEVAGRHTYFTRHNGIARGADPATGPRLEPEEEP